MKNEKEFKRLYPVTKNSILAKKYECSESYIRTLAAGFGVTKKHGAHNGRWTKRQELFVLKHYNKDMTALEISEKIGKTKFSIQDKYRELSGRGKKKTESRIV